MPVNDLLYRRPAKNWLDGLPLGNGRLGAMVLAGDSSVRLQLNDSTAWSGSPASEHRRGRVDADTAAAALADARTAIAENRPVDAERTLEQLQSAYSQSYLPFADVVLTVSDDGGHCGWKLQDRGLSLAEATHCFTLDGPVFLTQETFISPVDGVLVHRLQSTAPVDVTIALSTPLMELGRASRPDGVVLKLRLPADVAPGHEPNEPALRWEADGVTPLEGALCLAATHDGRHDDRHDGRHDGGASLFTGVTDLLLVIATETTFSGIGREPEGSAADCAEEVQERVEAAVEKGWDPLHRDHVAAHRDLFDRASLTFETGPQSRPEREGICTDRRLREANAHPAGILTADPELVALLFNYGRYLLICSSRPGTLPATLQGIWNEDMRPPWSSNYTLNINAEMNYWGAEAAALAECSYPLFDLAEALAERGRSTASTLYGARGWVAHHNSDAWGYSSPTAGHASWSQWPMAGPWLVRHLDEKRRFGSASPADLERLWALAVGAAEFVCDWLIDDGGTHLQTRPSTSPENCYLSSQGRAAVATSTAMDRALIRELFQVVLELAPLVGQIGHPVLDEVRAALPRIASPQVGSDGRILEWGAGDEEEDPQHRHVSHLFFAYPGNGPTQELTGALDKSLNVRGDNSTGWSLIWKICLRSRLRQGEKVADLLRLLFRPADATSGQHAGGLYNNFFAAHPPFQIDGNLGFIGALAEALVQSHADTIRLLPALPGELGSGRVRGLVARPGIAVDLVWQDGQLTEAILTPLRPEAAGERTVAVADWAGAVTLAFGQRTVLRREPQSGTPVFSTTQQENT
ncbi:glycoside hydrolase family 95 protein [Arthrobacter sp. JZ12]|uniref:glycosyl hydrolase family 95 catalytic domain-containing protein n=1 Tax=Arthrobacter sp. JZ12 TaxID=2654190 RepID=UPI002B498741|nr:glycoside hydrolase N-terminal domain-containing protein [Arthrobacter sp. JZ12]WRH24262.1 glycoside hydrolase family 95 protein [Arthrobacter sp. JZ12]